METVYIESSKPLLTEDMRPLLARHWTVEKTAGGGLAVHGAESRLYIENENDPDKPDCHQLLLGYSDENLVKEVLKVIADNPNLTVDNDFGVVLPGNQFVARLKAEPAWRWRQ